MNKFIEIYKIIILFIIFTASVFAQNTQLSQKSKDIEILGVEFSNKNLPKMSVILEFTDADSSKSSLDSNALFSAKKNSVMNLMGRNFSKIKQQTVIELKNLNMMSLEVDSEALKLLEQSGVVKRVFKNEVLQLFEQNPMQLQDNSSSFDFKLTDTRSTIQSEEMWAKNIDGRGVYVAVIDTGVPNTHQMFQNKTLVEACFSYSTSSQSSTVCPSGNEVQYGIDSARPVSSNISGYFHGTHVAGIATGFDASYGTNGIYGVARGANLLAIQSATQFNSTQQCDGAESCILPLTINVLAGLDYVYSQRNTLNIAAVNLSLGGGRYYSSCDDESPFTSATEKLVNAGIAVIAASGNEDYKDSIAQPACISHVISVGSVVYDGSTVNSFSNSANFLDLLAPGGQIISSVPSSSNSAYGLASGTSMAAPHVAGAFALYKQAFPSVGINRVLSALKSTGRNMRDTNGISKPLILLNNAYNELNTQPTTDSNIIPMMQLLLLEE